MIKLLFFIVFLWIVYKMNIYISKIRTINSNNQKKEKIDTKSRMDIQDAEYEEVE